MNTVKKGYAAEKWFRDWFFELGYMVDFKPRVKFNTIDIFGVWDFIARNKEQQIMVQVKSNMTHVSKAKTDIRRFANMFPPLISEQYFIMYKSGNVMRYWKYIRSVGIDTWREVTIKDLNSLI